MWRDEIDDSLGVIEPGEDIQKPVQKASHLRREASNSIWSGNRFRIP